MGQIEWYGNNFMVNIVIMRHGEAEPPTVDDQQRALTAQGRSEVQQMANWLTHAYPAFDYLWVSPYLRTRQTAALMLEAQQHGCQLQVMQQLVPDGQPEQVKTAIDLLLAAQPDARVLLVSHMPLVSFLVESLTEAGIAPIFTTAALCCIDYQTARGGKLLEQNSPLELTLLKS
jgi:phosphohistidine phosphatase